MIEEFISGREVTVSILENKALPIIEIRPKSAIYDYHAKYIDSRTEFLFDTVAPVLAEKIKTDAVTCFKALGLRHFARIDFILSDDRLPYVLEANTIPGLTSHSLVPKAARKAGLSMTDLCLRIIDAAIKDRKESYSKKPQALTGIKTLDTSKGTKQAISDTFIQTSGD